MCRYDARQGSFVAYLPIAEERGVEMMPDCNVERVLFEKSGAQVRVSGVEYTQNGVRHTLEASNVIVSAGTYATPVILYKSGYGPRELTDGTPIVENRNVGANTDNRPQVQGPIGIFDEPVSDGEFRHTGAYYIFHDTTPDKRYERIQIDIRANQVPYPDQAAINSLAPEFGSEHKQFMRDLWNTSKMTPARRQFARQCRTGLRLVRPRNIRGYINEWQEQIYRRNDPAIIKPLEEGRELIYEILKKMGAKEILGMDRPIRNPYLATFVGSCTGGLDPKTSVVDPNFQSHDIQGLFACCGSTVPRAASQGYAGSVATLALFAAHRIVEKNFKRG
jgi:choline dehydrogenase-like flavoprotein